MINLQDKMAVKVTKKVKYAMALYHKIMPQGVHFTWKVSCFFQKVHIFCTMPLALLILSYCTYIIVISHCFFP